MPSLRARPSAPRSRRRARRGALGRFARAESGASPVEFVLVGSLLTVLTLSVIQLGLAVYLRNVVHDAAVQGAFYGALADVDATAAGSRARELVERTVGPGFVERAEAGETTAHGVREVEVRVHATFPLVGLVGIPGGWEVTAHAPKESLDGP